MMKAGKFNGKLVENVSSVAQAREQDNRTALPSPIEHL
jgi:hypothetical protein